MFGDNLTALRKINKMTQEQLAEKVGVSRQAVAKWESGETSPDLFNSKLLADVFGVTIDDLVNPDTLNLPIPPKGKYIFGIATVGDKGQVVIPARARRHFDIKVGDRLVVLGDDASNGLALLKEDGFLKLAEEIKKY